jgi:hypothetical protein
MHTSRATADPLDLLKDSDPVRQAAFSSESIDQALADLGIGIVSGSRRPSRVRQRRGVTKRRGLLVAIAVALLGATAGAATVVWSAHTGRYPTEAEVAVGGPGEALDPAAPDFRAVALDLAADIPYPAGYGAWRDYLISREVDTASDGVLESTGALHGWFAASGFCAWVQTWRQADQAGDPARAGKAAQVIAQAPAWTAVTDEDPNPDPSAPNDPGAEPGTLFGWMLPYRDAVLANDRARVDHLLATGYGQGKCWSSDPEWMAALQAHPQWDTIGKKGLAQEYEQFLASARS